MTITNSHSTLNSRAPGLDETDAEKLARELYGFSGTARLLTAERDKNFLREAEDELRLVLKVSNPAEDRLVTNFQTSAMLHLELTSPHLMLPRIVRAKDGSVEVDVQLPDGQKSVARMCIGTSLAIIIPTSIQSFRAHRKCLRSCPRGACGNAEPHIPERLE